MIDRHRRSSLLAGCLLLAIGPVLAGCAGAPPEEEPPPEHVAVPTAAEIILDAEVLAQNNDFESAASMLEEVLDRNPENIEALRLLAGIYTAMDRTADASNVWRRVSVLDPADPDAAYEVGTWLARKGDWEGVRAKMLAAEAAGAADSRHFLLLGEADIELGYRNEAQTYLKQASDLVRAQYLLGELSYNRGKYTEAEAAFREVLRHHPDNQQAHVHLGWLKLRKGRREESLEHYREAVRLNPEDPHARLSLAALLEKMDRPEEAITHYREALSLSGIPRDKLKEAYNSCSRLLVEQGRSAEALTVIDQGLGIFSNAGGLYFQWGELLLKQGKQAEAKEKYKRAAEDPVWREVALHRLHSF